MGIKQLYNGSLRKLPNEYGDVSVMPDRVKMMNSNTKPILIVCEPVRRIVPAFSMRLAHGKIARNTTFGEYFFTVKDNNLKVREKKLTETSKYSEHLSSWLKLFSDKQMHIVNGDNLSLEPWVEISGVEEFFGVRRHLKLTKQREFSASNSNRKVYKRLRRDYNRRGHCKVSWWG